ncbi:hypothetical protein [Pseudomonas sp. NPDC007930]|uniref:hypothetical protein n=1 Tax=Pseudomonas sp. NPDC007930 TaxID=3364417 RepID=UPI0036EE22E4
MADAHARLHQLLDSSLPPLEAVQYLPIPATRRTPLGIGRPSQRVWRDGQALFGTTVLAACSSLPLLMAVYGRLRSHALQGDADALNDLGWLWLNGTRLQGDVPLARRLLRLAFVLGSRDAAFNLAEQAWHGLGRPLDKAVAAQYYEAAQWPLVGLDRGRQCR